jgi:hypothetical protein
MERVISLEGFDWIDKYLRSLNQRLDDSGKCTVKYFLPQSFNAYYKLLHPILKEENRRQVYWNELLEAYKIKINPEINWRTHCHKAFSDSLIGPSEGNLEEPTLNVLKQILLQSTSENQTIYFCYFFLQTSKLDGNEVWYLYKGHLNEMDELKKFEPIVGSPTYWWSDNKEWCICTDIDSSFSIIGATQELIMKLSKSQELEGFIIDENTKIYPCK